MNRFLLTIILASLSLLSMAYEKVNFHCDKDTTFINQLLSYPELKDMDKNEQLAFFAKKLVGAPSNLRSEILESDTVSFTIDIHTFNPLSFLSTCVALTQAYETSSAPNWRDFAGKYENVRFKGGKIGNYSSRMMYAADWIADNIFRGNIYDATQRVEGLNVKRREKSIYYISKNKDSFNALSDPLKLDLIKMLEMGFRNHQIIYISNGDLTNPGRYKKTAKDGDIVFLLSPDESLDCREMGIVCFDGDDLRFIQVSIPREKIVMEELPFENYVKRNIKRIQGARVMRLQ